MQVGNIMIQEKIKKKKGNMEAVKNKKVLLFLKMGLIHSTTKDKEFSTQTQIRPSPRLTIVNNNFSWAVQ